MKVFPAVAVVVALSGCATPPLTPEQLEAMNKPTFSMSCGGPCDLAYTDPRDRPAMPTNGWDVANTAIGAAAGVLTSTAPWAAIGITAVKGIDAAMGDDNSVRVDNRDNSLRVDNRTDSTHQPTVISAPDPVIIPSPNPVIVRPEIVRPEVIQPPTTGE